MPDTDPAASALDGIRETLHVAGEQGFAEWDDAYLPSALYRHTVSLLAAAEAALKLADELTGPTVAANCLDEELIEVRRECGERFRRAIPAALTERKAGDDDTQ